MNASLALTLSLHNGLTQIIGGESVSVLCFFHLQSVPISRKPKYIQSVSLNANGPCSILKSTCGLRECRKSVRMIIADVLI